LLLSDAPGNIRIPARANGLTKALVVNVSQIITIDKSYLTKRIRTLKDNYMKEVDDDLRLVLSV
jgi:mRNA interferase MazF